MEIYKNVEAIKAETREQWRNWLAENHDSRSSIWLIIYKMQSGIDSVYYPEAVDEALCFGWVDSKINKRDDESYYQYFAKRNPKSNWSKVNKDKVERLISEGLIQPSGYKMIEIAKESGTWTALDDVENLILPIDLEVRFASNRSAKINWDNFPKSVKRGILEWLLNAKKLETRQKRIEEIVRLAAENIRANF